MGWNICHTPEAWDNVRHNLSNWTRGTNESESGTEIQFFALGFTAPHGGIVWPGHSPSLAQQLDEWHSKVKTGSCWGVRRMGELIERERNKTVEAMPAIKETGKVLEKYGYDRRLAETLWRISGSIRAAYASEGSAPEHKVSEKLAEASMIVDPSAVDQKLKKSPNALCREHGFRRTVLG